MLEELAGDDRVEARVPERQRLLDVRLDGLDPERPRFLERRGVHVEPDHGVALEEVLGQRARAAAEVEHALPAADRLDEERDPLGDEDEVALVAAFAVVLFVALAEVAHGGRGGGKKAPKGEDRADGASCPSDAIVRLRRPSSSAISGSQPRICFARVMSGWRTCGSSTGQRLVDDLARRAREAEDDLGELEERLLVRVAEVHGQVLPDSASRTMPRMRSST